MSANDSKSGLRISKNAFFASAAILFFLILFAGILTLFVPQGEYARAQVDGRSVVVADSFTYIDSERLPVYRWFTAPFEVFLSSDAPIVIVIILFLLAIGGSITVLDHSGMIQSFMYSITKRFKDNKYSLMKILILCFMLFGSTFGLFEETVVLTPIVIAIAYALGWDALVGMGMSVLAAVFGFTCALTNPFTLGVAQSLAGLPPFSGILFRLAVFVLCYFVLYTFVSRYARKIEKNPELSAVYADDKKKKESMNAIPDEVNENVVKAVSLFKLFLLFIALLILASIFVPGLSAVSLPLVAIIFLAGSLIAGRRARYTDRLAKDFFSGVLMILPGIFLIPLAMSVKVIIENGRIMDTILYSITQAALGRSPFTAVLVLFLVVLVMNFFIASGSTKAFLVIPIIAPLADLLEISRQTTVLAFLLGDGFSNVLYPTNPVLMILLGLTGVSYLKWFKWIIKLQLFMVVVSLSVLFIAMLIGY